MERHEVPLETEARTALPLLERALTGRAGDLPRPPPAPPPDEESRLHDAADDLVAAFATALEDSGSPLAEDGPFVAHCMLDWKIGYADGELLRWTLGDLREFMLDWFPRKVTADDGTVAVAGEAIIAFLRFLAEQELLDAPVPVGSLEAAVARLRPRFERACRDPRSWDLAKSMFAGMSVGVDPQHREAVQDWIAEFNERSYAERDALLGPPADRMLAAAGRAPAGRRAKRKAAKKARKRNRR